MVETFPRVYEPMYIVHVRYNIRYTRVGGIVCVHVIPESGYARSFSPVRRYSFAYNVAVFHGYRVGTLYERNVGSGSEGTPFFNIFLARIQRTRQRSRLRMKQYSTKFYTRVRLPPF